MLSLCGRDSSAVARLTVEQSIKSSSPLGSNKFYLLNRVVPIHNLAIVYALVAAIYVVFLFVLSSLYFMLTLRGSAINFPNKV